MNIIKLIYDFKKNDSCLWAEGNHIKLFVADKFKDYDNYAGEIKKYKAEIIECLISNKIFSKSDFQKKIIFKSNQNITTLSFAQERLWFIEKYEGGTNAYHLPWVFELDSETDVQGIIFALQQIVARHEVLRSTIELSDTTEQGVQIVHNELLVIEQVTIPEKDDHLPVIKADINRPFDLSSEFPIRVKFYNIQAEGAEGESLPTRTFLLVNFHHIASDGWSWDIFERDLFAYYEAYLNKDTGFRLPELEIQYKDYAVWQRTYLTGAILEKQLTYWKEKLSGYQTLELPADHPRPLKIDYSGACRDFTIKPETGKKLRTLARNYGVTLHTVLLSSINILLGKYTGQDDIVTGSPVANRHHRQTEGLIGFFVNTLVNRTLLSSTQSFADLIKQVQQEQIQAQLHQDLPFEMLVNKLGVARDPARHPVFQVVFVVQSFGNQNQAGNQQINYLNPYEAEDIYEVEKFDLSISVDDSSDELKGQISYAIALFESSTIARLTHSYLYLLDQLVAAPEQPYSRLSLLTPEVYRQVVYEWNMTDKSYPQDQTIHALFEAQVANTPDNTAIVYQDTSLSYRELNEKSNQMARVIQDQYQQKAGRPLTRDSLIAICVDRGLEMVIGIIAVLKAGAAYVPIDPGYPRERINYLLADTQAALILTQRRLNEGGQLQLAEDKVIYIDLTETLYNEKDTANLASISKPCDLAYVIYTSGTTGKPKGVMVEHISVVNLLTDLRDKYQITSQERFLLFASYIFDASVEQMWLALSSGNALYLIDDESLLDAARFTVYIADNQITHLHATPSFLNAVYSENLQGLKRVVFGAEYLSKQLFDQYKSVIPTVINEYGPTETTITSLTSINSHLLGKASIGNVSAYVLDANNNPVPIGVTGELHIGGAGLARGYLNRPELTKERFVANPLATAADKAKGYTRLYKTGDLVRWLPDGNLEYIGRNDEQVKINGYRIELAEIGHAVTSIKSIKQACVLAKERKTGAVTAKYLVCYYVGEQSEEKLTPSMIQNKLLEVLPSYMVPGMFVPMESFPITVNGKLDKRAFPDPNFNLAETGYTGPETEIEAAMCKLWQQLLGLEQAGITDDFFRIGGNSILAIQVSHRMSKALGSDVRVADVFKYKTISQLLVHCLGKIQVTIPRIDSNQAILSFAQERLWFIEQYEEGTNAYHMPELFVLAPDAKADGIKYALQNIVSRHEVLRSKIERADSQEHYIQKVCDEPLIIEDALLTVTDDYTSLIKADVNRPFDLSNGYPIRVKFYNIEPGDSRERKTFLLINIHHIANDGWSRDLFQKEMAAYYEAYLSKDKGFRLPDLEIQYKDYAVWQRAYLTGDILEKQLAYWKAKLSGYQTLELPVDFPRPNNIDYTGGEYNFTISREISQKLRALAQAYGVTLHTVLLSSMNILLSKYTGQDDIVTGSPIANRHHRQTEGLIGFFVNTLVNRTLLSEVQSFADLIKQVHWEQVQAQLHQDLPFEMLVNELDVDRDPSKHPIFQVLFVVQSFGNQNQAGNQQISYLKPYEAEGIYEVEKFDLSISVDDNGDELKGLISYGTALFESRTIARLTHSYLYLLDQLVAAPEQPYSRLSLLTPEAYRQIVYEWNMTDKSYPQDKTLHALFEAQAANTPDNTAIIYQSASLSYRELNEKSNQLAREIRDQYHQKAGRLLRPDSLIAICVERGLEMVIGIIAILKAGGAYVPIDPGYPRERINYLLADTQAALILTQRRLNEVAQLQLAEDKVIYIDLTETLYQEKDAANLASNSTPKSLAYVIYTSGTTGTPNGVMVEHLPVSNRILHMISYSSINSGDYYLFKTNYVFDVSVSDLFTHLCTGAKLHITKQVFDLNELEQLLLNGKFTSIHLVPSQYDLLSAIINNSSINKIYFSGEAITAKIISGISKKINIYNYYGPTETGEITVSNPKTPLESPVIGKIFTNSRQYVLGSNNIPVPIGVAGELLIGGVSLARGYLNCPDLSADRFIANPFATEADKAMGYNRLYKTGDLVRWWPDGNLEYIGRNDEQVKLHGYRIELGEIEHALMKIEGIKQACVLAKERSTETSSTQYLAAYYVADKSAERLSPAIIQNKLLQVLPGHMVPGSFIEVESLPLTVNGKLDKKALPDPDFSDGDNYIRPNTELEIKLGRIYEKVLGMPVEQIGTHQNFFKMGGNSILSIRLKLELNKLEEFKHLNIADIFKYNSINRLIQSIQKDNATGYKLQNSVMPGKKHEIAIIGISGAFTGVKDVDGLWRLIENQQEGISFHSYDECRQSGVAEYLLDDPNFVRVSGQVKGIEYFDPLFWEMSPKEAKQLDPQYRKFIEHCWFALESSGYVRERKNLNIGVFAGSGDSFYLYDRIINSDTADEINLWEAANSNSKDALATKTAYLLDLSGPALSINTACSTGLVSVVEACKNLHLGTCNMALSGGVSLIMPDEEAGYLYEEDMILSKDGHCRTFDKDASGITLGSGVGVVLLKRLEDAVKDNDDILGVIKGYSTNNDGARKTGYTAPSVIGQSECIINAQKMAGVTPDQIDYVECHGTATHLGDPIEIQALKEAFKYNRAKDGNLNHQTILGAIKANIGHTGSAAGTAGLIKVCAMLKNNIIPGQVNFKEPNPELHLKQSGFRIVTENLAWLPQSNKQRLAGVSSFGIGGTNAHVIIGDYFPQLAIADITHKNVLPLAGQQENDVNYIIPLSAKSRLSLEHFKQALITSLTNAKTNHHPPNIRDIAYSLQEKKEHFNFRSAWCARTIEELIGKLRSDASFTQIDTKNNNKIVFMFPGQGAQYPRMAWGLYHHEPDFKNTVDHCIKLANLHLGVDLMEVMYPKLSSPLYNIDETQWAQVALFIIEYALAKYLNHLGVYADAYVGHSIGEYVAATLSGVFSLEDAIKIVITRGKLMQSMPRGSMLAVNAPYDSVVYFVKEYNCEIACINSFDDVVVSGTEEAVQSLKERFDSVGIPATVLNTSHAFHSEMMEQAVNEFESAFRGVKMNRPRNEFVGNLTGEFAKEEVTTAKYWCNQLRYTVQFAKGVTQLSNRYSHRVSFVEVGPGKILGYLINKHKNSGNYKAIQTIRLLPSAKESKSNEYPAAAQQEDIKAALWSNGVVQMPNDIALFKGAKFQSDLPLYQFDFQKCWLEKSSNRNTKKYNSIEEIFYQRSWQRAGLDIETDGFENIKDKNVLVLINDPNYRQNKTGALLNFLESCCHNLNFVVHQQTNNIKPDFTFDFGNLSHVSAFLNENALVKPIDIIIYISPTIDPDHPCLDIFAVKNIFHWSKDTGNKIAKIISISFDNYEVTGNETLPERPSIIQGVTKSIPFEYHVQGIKSFHIDLSAQDSNYRETLLSILEKTESEGLIALRGKYKWVPVYQHLKPFNSQTAPLNHSVVLITGGLGAIGYAYANYVAQNNKKCTLILLGRTPESNLRADYKLRLAGLRDTKHRIIYSTIDIGQASVYDELKEILEDNQIHNIDVVLHSAGVAAKNALSDKTYDDIEKVVNPKITGVENLIKLSKSIAIGYLVCCSSGSSIIPSLGNMEYTAANLYLDEICHRTYANIKHLLALNLNQISDTGMAVDFLKCLTIKQGTSADSIKSYEFPGIVQKLLHAKAGKSIVLSRYDVNDEYNAQVNSIDNQKVKNDQAKPIKILEDNYTDLHYQIAQIFCKALGLDQISIYDDFFTLGGNSMLAIWVSHRMSELLLWDVKVADIFRLKTIDGMLVNQSQYRELVKPYKTNYNPNLDDLFFVHPGYGGSEVYQHLSELLAEKYNCIGIDNYNIHHKEKIGSLNGIAGHYLSILRKKYPLKEPVNLLGWSMGGQIALEMASILEAEGHKDLHITLLDSFIQDETMKTFLNKNDQELIALHEKNMMLMKYDEAYVEKVFSAHQAEIEIANGMISTHLKYSTIVLFKANQVMMYDNIEGSEFKNEYIKKLGANNIDLVADHIQVFNLDCSHDNILETNSAVISNYLLSKDRTEEQVPVNGNGHYGGL